MGTHSLQATHGIFIATVEMVQSGETGLPLCRQGGNQQRRTTTQVGAGHVGTAESRHALHHRYPTVHVDAGAHTGQLIHVAIAVFKNRFDAHGGSLPRAGRRQ